MKIAIVNSSEKSGGAARAANRLHKALMSQEVDSHMIVDNKQSDDWRVQRPNTKVGKALSKLRPILDRFPIRFQRTSSLFPHSVAWTGGLKAKMLNGCVADVVNLHWICAGFLSIEEIGRIKKPLVWTLHDMWPFSGAEHYSDYSSTARWRTGYTADNRPVGHGGLDIDRWVWKRKYRSWQAPIYIVTPSQWLGDCARQSLIMQDWPIFVIPNPLDTRQFQPWPKAVARQILGLPDEQALILFGAMGGGRNPAKGWDLLQMALIRLASQMTDISAVVFGQSRPLVTPRLGLPIYWMGHLSDDTTLALLYSAVDVMVVPSRQENLPQSGTEAQSCGRPVVAFNTSGLPSVVVHQETGYLAEPFNIDDLAAGITWVLTNSERYEQLSRQARERALRLWSPDIVVAKYLNVYQQAIRQQKINNV